MALDPDPEPVREPADRAFEPRIGERDQPPAAPADEVVMMMMAAGVKRLEPGLPLAHRDALDEAVLDEQVEHAVDARAGGRPPRGAERILDFDRAQRARLDRQHFDDPFPRAASLETRAREHRLYVIAPLSRHQIQSSAPAT